MPPAVTSIRTCSFRSARPGPRCARSTRQNGSAGPARRRASAWPGRWTNRLPMVCGEAPRRTSGALSETYGEVTTTSQEGDDDDSYQRAEHREHGTQVLDGRHAGTAPWKT